MNALGQKQTSSAHVRFTPDSGHRSQLEMFLRSAMGGHSAKPSRASRTLSRSHEVEVAIDQNFTRHLLGTLRALYLVSKIVVWGSGNSKPPRGETT